LVQETPGPGQLAGASRGKTAGPWALAT
jgi:hypothetical protein